MSHYAANTFPNLVNAELLIEHNVQGVDAAGVAMESAGVTLVGGDLRGLLRRST